MSLGPIQPVSLADRAYDQLVAALLRGALSAGQPLVQDVLAEQLGISRTPVREALLRMERQGMLRASGRSFVVPELSGRDLEELYSVREAVEGHAARLLVEQGPQAVERVAMELHELAEQSWTTGDAAYHANRLAHRSVIQATGNRVLLEMFDDLWGRAVALRIWADYYASTPMEGDVEFDHELLLSALRSGSPDRAQQAMVEHVREGLHRHGTRSVTAP